MTDQIEEIIREIASEHGIALSRDDPILILQTINARLIKEHESAQKELLNQFKSELEVAASNWSEISKKNATQILNSSINASKATLETLINENSDVVVKKLNNERSACIADIAEMARSSKIVAILNITAAFMTLLASSVVFYLFVR
jgi:Transcriptional activator TraM